MEKKLTESMIHNLLDKYDSIEYRISDDGRTLCIGREHAYEELVMCLELLNSGKASISRLHYTGEGGEDCYDTPGSTDLSFYDAPRRSWKLTPMWVHNLLETYTSIDYKCADCADHELARLFGEGDIRFVDLSKKGGWGTLWQGADELSVEFFISLINSGTAELWRFNRWDEESQTEKEEFIQDIDLARFEYEPHGRARKGYHYRIRKLTPRECFRLQGVSEENIDLMQQSPLPEVPDNPRYDEKEQKVLRSAMAKGISESQQYKLAGNSITVDVMVYMFRNLFATTEEGLEEQLQLF